MNGVTILFVYAVIMILATVILTKKEKNVERFCVGSRSENWLMSALSIAATWIWAPALFVSTEKAYSTGWVGLFWFLVPNALCLVIFIPFAKKIRKEMPEGMTLSGYMKEKYQSDGVKRVYLFQLIGLSVLSTGVQLLAGSQILSAVTGISFKTMTILLACIAISYSLFSGIKASMLTDAIQMVFMLVACSLFVIFGVRNTGTQGIIQGLSGISGDCTTLFSGKGVEIFLAFGLPTTIGLLSGPFGDQSFWQRAYNLRQIHTADCRVLLSVMLGNQKIPPAGPVRLGDRIGVTPKQAFVCNDECRRKKYNSRKLKDRGIRHTAHARHAKAPRRKNQCQRNQHLFRRAFIFGGNFITVHFGFRSSRSLATPNITPSCIHGAAICTPSGIPSPSTPNGTDIAGTPARLSQTVE